MRQRPAADLLHAPAIGRGEVIDDLALFIEQNGILVWRVGSYTCGHRKRCSNGRLKSRTSRTATHRVEMRVHVVQEMGMTARLGYNPFGTGPQWQHDTHWAHGRREAQRILYRAETASAWTPHVRPPNILLVCNADTTSIRDRA